MPLWFTHLCLSVASLMERYELVIRFLHEIGAAREAQMYVRLFQREEPSRFAIIEVGEDLAPVSLHVLALNLSYLAALDLYPVVVHAGVATDARGRRTRTRNGRRERTLAVNETLLGAIEVENGSSEGVVTGVFQAEGSRRAGEPMVRLGRIRKAVASDSIPVVAALASPARPGARATRITDTEPIALRTATLALARRLRPRKIILLSESGGIRRDDGSLVDYVNLQSDRARLVEQGHLAPRSLAELEAIERLLGGLPPRAFVQVASPGSLLRELFTQKGAGTLLKRGRALSVHQGLAGVSRDRIRSLIERSFGKRLDRGYFTGRNARRAPFRTVIVDPDYKGVAIVRELDGLPYLDKFAVRPETRGEGIATDLWSMLVKHHPGIFWRSRPENPINGWYWEQADGCVKRDDWWIWWRGLDETSSRRAIRLAAELPATLA